MNRTLSLKRETLTDLTGDELAYIVGGEPSTTGPQPTPPIFFPTYQCTTSNLCVTRGTTCLC